MEYGTATAAAEETRLSSLCGKLCMRAAAVTPLLPPAFVGRPEEGRGGMRGPHPATWWQQCHSVLHQKQLGAEPACSLALAVWPQKAAANPLA